MTKAFALSLQSLGTCSSFHAENLVRRCLTRITYFANRGSRDSYYVFTCPTTNWESLRIISLSVDIATANSILARMTSYSDSLFESLKPSRIAYLILSPPKDFIADQCRALVCRDAPSTLRATNLNWQSTFQVGGFQLESRLRFAPS